jgi:ABC-type multidrug transport system ATPase subunit
VTALLKVEGLKKSFGGVHALRNGQFELQSGSVHALCGGNGAGKSTFLLILMGVLRRDDGKIWRNGKEVVFAIPAEALASGIAIIEQELSPIPNMTVAENIFLGREPSGRFGGIDFRKMNAAAQAILDDLGFAIPANRMMVSLSVAQAQLVEIAKALSHDAEVIFMDEPTSAIGEREALQLFAVIQMLKAQGRGIVYVSHRLSEIFGVADQYTVFRDGAYVASGPQVEMTLHRLCEGQRREPVGLDRNVYDPALARVGQIGDDGGSRYAHSLGDIALSHALLVIEPTDPNIRVVAEPQRCRALLNRNRSKRRRAWNSTLCTGQGEHPLACICNATLTSRSGRRSSDLLCHFNLSVDIVEIGALRVRMPGCRQSLFNAASACMVVDQL